MVALQDGQTPNAFFGSSKSHKNRKGLDVLPPEEVQLIYWLHRIASGPRAIMCLLLYLRTLKRVCQIAGTCQGHCRDCR